MNQIFVLLSVIALAAAQLTCFANTTQFATICVSGSPNCTWTNEALWTNCNNSYPDSTFFNANIFNGGAYTLTISTPIDVANITVGSATAQQQTLYVNAALSSQNIDVISGNLIINDSITLAAGAQITLGNGSTSTWANGDLTIATGGVSTSGILVTGSTLILGTGTKSTTQDIYNYGTVNVNSGSTLSLTGATIFSNGTFNIEGTTTINGDANSLLQAYGTFILSETSQAEVVTFALPTMIYSSINVANATLNANSKFYVQNLNVLPTGTVNIANSGNSTLGISFQSVYNQNTMTWSNGNDFTITKNDGFFNNTGTFTVSSSGATYTSFAPFANSGFLVITAPLTFISPLNNVGTVMFNAAVSVTGVNSNTTTVNHDGGSLSGTGSVNMNANLSWTNGNITVPTVVSGVVSISNTAAYKSLGSTLVAPRIELAAGVDLTTNFVNGQTSTFFGNNGVISTSTGATFTNNGVMGGTVNFNGVSVVNNGLIGGSIPTYLNVTNAALILTNSSVLTLPIMSSVSPITLYHSVDVNTYLTLGGYLNIVIKNGFNPSNGNLTLISRVGNTEINGSFISMPNITQEAGANTLNCNVTYTANNVTDELILFFNGCSDAPPAASSSSPNHNTAIIIGVVVAVVLVVLAIVAFVIYRRRHAATHAEKQRLI